MGDLQKEEAQDLRFMTSLTLRRSAVYVVAGHGQVLYHESRALRAR